MQKLAVKIILPLLILGGIYFILDLKGVLPPFLSINNAFKQEEIQLKDTPLLLEEVKSIAQLFSASSYEEVIIDTSKQVEKNYVNSLLSSSDTYTSKFVLLASGTCMAGTDLAVMTEDDFVVKDSTLTLTIPPVQILSTIVNPSNFEIYIDDGDWSPEEVKAIKVRATKKIEKLSIEDGLLTKASERTKLLLEQFYKSLGFATVTIIEKGAEKNGSVQ